MCWDNMKSLIQQNMKHWLDYNHLSDHVGDDISNDIDREEEKRRKEGRQ